MKVGNKVVCVSDGEGYWQFGVFKGDEYIISDIFKDSEEGLFPGAVLLSLSGINAGVNQHTGIPFGFDINDFREIQPPLDITALIEECKTETV